MPNHWRPFAQRTTALEKLFLPKIRRVIVAFRQTFISDLKSHGLHYAQSQLQQQLHSDKLLPTLNSIYSKAGLMGARLSNEEIKKAVSQKAGGFGRNEQWIKYILNYLKLHGLELAQNITETMKGDIVKILSQAGEHGWTIDQMVRELRGSGLIEARAKVIARTEIVRAANVGHQAAAQSQPYEMNKKWVAAQDHRTRHSHKQINGTMVDEDEFFKVSIDRNDKPTGAYDEMSFPGDPHASAGNTINCRCRVVYVPKEDANGNLIRRNPNQAPVIPMRRPQQLPLTGIAAVLKENIYIGVEK